MDGRDRWLEERNRSPPPGNRWLANYDPQQIAAVQRSAWDGACEITPNHFLKSSMSEGHVKTTWFNNLIDRRIVHTKGDRHPFCSSHVKASDNFVGLCSQRLGPTPPRQDCDASTLQRIAERKRADEDKIKQRFRERRERQRAAERQIMHAPPPGSRQAKQLREAQQAARRPASARERQRGWTTPGVSDDAPDVPMEASASEDAHARWQRQFGDGKGHTERLTGHYVHSLDDVGRMERVPSERKVVGRQRLTEQKANSFFSSSLRDHEPTYMHASPRRQSARGKGNKGGRSTVTL